MALEYSALVEPARSVSAPNSPVWTRKFVPSMGHHRADTLHMGHEQLPGLTSEPDSTDDEAPPANERRKSGGRKSEAGVRHMSGRHGDTNPMHAGHEQLPHSQSLDSVEGADGDTDQQHQEMLGVAHERHISTQDTSGVLEEEKGATSVTHRDDNVAPVATDGAEDSLADVPAGRYVPAEQCMCRGLVC